jgi:FAD/FMN-containing dehydrogenase
MELALDPQPAAIVEASGVADVREAVAAAREQDLPLAVWATGHGTHVPPYGAVMLSTSAMATVLVDPDRRVARVGPGATWGAVLEAAAPFGLAPLSGSSATVGVVGYTLGGGIGWLSRKHGFAADSVLRAEVVTADGRRVTASPDVHPDLFWALRGGGGSFGVVTSLEFRLHPVSRVYAGTSYFAIERAAETLARYREWIADAPDELSTAVVLGPDGLAIKVMYAGAAEDAERHLRPLREAAGPAVSEGFEVVAYADAAMGGTPPVHLDLFDDLPDEVIDALVGATALATIEVRHWGGAMARPAADAGPVGDRTTPLSVIVDTRLPALAATLRRHATGGSFLNFLKDTTRTETAYTPDDYERLREIKLAYDPDNVFRFGHTIPPTAVRRRAARTYVRQLR